MHLSVITTFFFPKIWVYPPNIFHKSTPVHLGEPKNVAGVLNHGETKR